MLQGIYPGFFLKINANIPRKKTFKSIFYQENLSTTSPSEIDTGVPLKDTLETLLEIPTKIPGNAYRNSF